MRKKAPSTRLIALLLAFALVQVSFGPEAWAQVVPRVGAVEAPVGGVSAVAGPVNGSLSASFGAIAPLSAASLTASPSAPSAFLPALSEAPSLPLSAIAAPAPASRLAAARDSAANSPAPTPDAAPSAEPRLESGPGAARAASRMAVRAAELKNFFSGRRDAGALPEAAPAADAKGTKRMLGRYVLASNVSQAGYELFTSASLPVYLDQTFHKISLMADLSIIGALASVVGRQLSPLLINSMPLKKSYVMALGAAFLAVLAFGALANLHALTILPLFGLMIVFRLAQAGAVTAQRTVIPSVLGKDQIAIERLRGVRQSWAEVASVLVQNGAAALVVLLGTATKNLLIAPFFFLAAVALLWATLKIPEAADEARLTAWRDQAGRAAGGGLILDVFKNFGSQLTKGWKVVMHDPALRASAMITTLIVLFNVLTYTILGPAFGELAAGAGAASTSAAPIMGLVIGLFSFGGLFAGKLVAKQSRKIEAEHAGDPAAAAEAARASTMRWLKYGALSFLAVGAMALPLPFIGPLIHLGSHAVVAVTAVLGTGTVLAMWKPKLGLALALSPVLLAFPAHVALAAGAFFVFGLLQVVASLKNDSLFDKLVQERAPADYANAAAFVGSFSMFAGVLGLAALKFLIYGSLPFGIPSPLPAFTGLPGLWPFVAIFGGLAVPAMLAMRHYARRLDRFTK